MGYTKSVFLWILSLVFVQQSVSSLPQKRHFRRERCFEDLGCFSIEAPFNNTFGRLPRRFDVTFRLFTKNCSEPSVIYDDSMVYRSKCHINHDLPIKFVVHGFWQTGQNKWVSDAVSALLEKEPMNIITVDWGKGAGYPYSQAAANTRVVAAKMSRLIKMIKIHPKKVHIIGFSLGAHIAGYVGETLKDIGRITGLDPAEPSFNNTESVVHLEKTDAAFVDIIHTDGNGWGWMKDIGDIDFYPNGGQSQPGCTGMFDVSCSHARATQLFIESVNTEYPFYGHPCKSIDDLDSNNGNCFICSHGICPEMGYKADKSFTKGGKYFLRTREERPYGGNTWNVEVEFGNMEVVSGQIIVEMVDDKKVSTSIVLGSGGDSFRSGDRRDSVTVNRQKVEDVTELKVKFSQKKPWYYMFYNSDEFVEINKVTVTSAVNGRSIHFCGDHVTVYNGNTANLARSTTDPNECFIIPTDQQRYSQIPEADHSLKPMASSTMSMKTNSRLLTSVTNTSPRTFPERSTNNVTMTRTE